jgi:hypothetical protein
MAHEPMASGTPDRAAPTHNADLEQLDEQIIDVLTEDHPQSVRHAFYMMTHPRLAEPVEKCENAYDLPAGALQVAKAAEESEREDIDRMARILGRAA